MSVCVLLKVDVNKPGLTSSAVHVSRHLDGHVEVHSLGLRETVGSRHVVCDLERDLASGSQRVTSGVHVALSLMVSHCIIDSRFLYTRYLTV